AAEMGIPAMVLFLIIVLVCIKENLWLYKNTEDKFFKAVALGFLGGIFALLMSNMFGSRMGALEISGYFWALAGMTMRIKSMEVNKINKNKTNTFKGVSNNGETIQMGTGQIRRR
ncbi:MAG: hypothetical protein ACI9F2_001016, partial [Lysobacterales bacterium]